MPSHEITFRRAIKIALSLQRKRLRSIMGEAHSILSLAYADKILTYTASYRLPSSALSLAELPLDGGQPL